MVPTQGFGEYPHNAASFGHIQDPRHQKLVIIIIIIILIIKQQRAASRDELKHTIPRVRTIGNVISGHAHAYLITSHYN